MRISPLLSLQKAVTPGFLLKVLPTLRIDLIVPSLFLLKLRGLIKKVLMKRFSNNFYPFQVVLLDVPSAHLLLNAQNAEMDTAPVILGISSNASVSLLLTRHSLTKKRFPLFSLHIPIKADESN